MSNLPIEWRIPLGREHNVTYINKFGFNPAVVAGHETIWDVGGLYNYLTAATVLKVSSDDVGDTGYDVDIYGLDANYDAIVETITLTGLTAVITTKAFLRVFRMISRRPANVTPNTGDLYAGTGAVAGGVPAVIYAKITAGSGQSQMCMVTIPRGHTGLLLGYSVAPEKLATITSELYFRLVGECFTEKDISPTYESPICVEFLTPEPIPAKSDIEVRVVGGAVAKAVGGRLHLVLVRT